MKGCSYKQNKDVIFRQEEDEALLFNPDTLDTFVINATGCFIWQLFDGKRTEKEITEMITQTFEVDLETAEKDLTKYLVDLEKRNFIKQRT